jgi:hypothetical protein
MSVGICEQCGAIGETRAPPPEGQIVCADCSHNLAAARLKREAGIVARIISERPEERVLSPDFQKRLEDAGVYFGDKTIAQKLAEVLGTPSE